MNIENLESLLFDDKDFKELLKITRSTKRTIFDVISKQSDELTFSRTLKYFLDPKEDHYQNAFFLKEFLNIFIKYNKKYFEKSKINRIFSDTIAIENTNVYREYTIETYGRIDIFAELRGEFAFLIENKLFSNESEEQTIRYSEWAEQNIKGNYKIILFCFLTPLGVTAESPKFRPLSFQEILPLFTNSEIIENLNKKNQYLISNFSDWIKNLLPMNKKTKEICMRIYKKYKDEIELILENAATTTAFFKEMVLKNKTNHVITHSGKNWMTCCPKKWIKNEHLKESTKYSKIRLEYSLQQDEKLYLSLVVPNVESYLTMISLISRQIFEREYEKIHKWNNWGSTYLTIEDWESFSPENYIDNWDKKIVYYNDLIFQKLKYIEPIIDNELKSI